MATTFLDLAQDALTEIGSLGVGEVCSSDDAFLCMRIFNEMSAEWSTDRLLLFTIGSQQFNLTQNKQSYQVGPGGADFPSVPRPVLIQSGATIINGTTIRVGMDLLSSQEFAAIREQGLTGVLPDKLYFDYGMPYGTMYVHPVPSSAITIELYTFAVLQQIVNLTDILNFPPGYENALKYNLAVKICASFGMPLQQQTVQQAATGKGAIAQINANLYRGALGTSSLFPLPTEGAPTPPQPQGPPQGQ